MSSKDNFNKLFTQIGYYNQQDRHLIVQLTARKSFKKNYFKNVEVMTHIIFSYVYFTKWQYTIYRYELF